MENRQLSGACLIGQSGGPSSVINASVYGIIQAARADEHITRILAAHHGVKGILDDDIFDLDKEDEEQIELLPTTPASALGTCRVKLKKFEDDDSDYIKVLEVFKKYDVRYFFLIGGNDSMDTCSKLNDYMQQVGYDCVIMGVAKTIDNDLYGTDHTPGYGSAAKYVASTFMEVYQDANVYDTPMVVIVEVMGRNAGWLTAASTLASSVGGLGPDLVYLPEVPFDMDTFMNDVKRVYQQKNHVLVAISEGVKDENGIYISEYGDLGNPDKRMDAFGHTQMGGLALKLVGVIKTYLNVKTRDIELSLLQRCSEGYASNTDIEEAKYLGSEAVRYAREGENGKMVGFRRVSDDPYEIVSELLPLDRVANFEQKIPLEWIKKDRTGLTEEFARYALPLIQGEPPVKKVNGLPKFAHLKMIKAEAEKQERTL